MLEPLVDAWEEEPSCQIKMHLLTAAVKLFFKRPPEMQVLLYSRGLCLRTAPFHLCGFLDPCVDEQIKHERWGFVLGRDIVREAPRRQRWRAEM